MPVGSAVGIELIMTAQATIDDLRSRALADLGPVVATPEYRRVRGGGGWPVTGVDVHLASPSAHPESVIGGLDQIAQDVVQAGGPADPNHDSLP